MGLPLQSETSMACGDHWTSFEPSLKIAWEMGLRMTKRHILPPPRPTPRVVTWNLGPSVERLDRSVPPPLTPPQGLAASGVDSLDAVEAASPRAKYTDWDDPTPR